MIAVHPLVQSGDDCPLLSRLTTIEVGGKPQFFARVESEDSAIEVALWAKARGLKVRIVGGGSNIVVDDVGLEGLVMQLAIPTVLWELDPIEGQKSKSQRVQLGAGVVWDEFVEESVKRGLAGVECLVGIPGWAGAAPIQNIGAYGQSFSDCCVEVSAFDLKEEVVKRFSAEECEFGYRDSLFKRSSGRYIILNLTLLLEKEGAPSLFYPQLADRVHSDHNDRDPTLSEVCRVVKLLRAEKSMLWHKDDPNHRSVGSFFMNPIINVDRAEELLARCDELGILPAPLWPSGEGLVKIPAAWLIEQSKFQKGTRRGDVGLSSRHCLSLINCGGASYEALLKFGREIQRQVWSNFRVWLQPEAQIFTDQEDFPPLGFAPYIALATCRNLPEWEVDDHPLWDVLRSKGVELAHPAWDDVDFKWEHCDLVIPRTTWDYQGRWPEFLAWMREVDQRTHLLNPISLMSWNLDKRYLLELKVPQPPCHWVEMRTLDQSQLDSLTEEILALCREHQWRRAFLKPTIGASAIGTLRFNVPYEQDSASGKELKAILKTHLQEWVPKRSMILQPYVSEVEEQGECSLIYFGGEFSHAVRKVPVTGDYRVQDDYGASDMPWSPPEAWRQGCDELLSQLNPMPLYARCDFLHGPNHEPWLIELELIEPSLFFRHDHESPKRFADAILARLDEIWKSN